MNVRQLILASGSPRRSELLRRLNLAFIVRPPDVDESILPNEHPLRYVERVARAKAAAECQNGEVVLAADTSVFIDGQILGKPQTPRAAIEMVSLLSGRTHFVYTGVALSQNSGVFSTVERTAVTFADLDSEEIEAYVATGDPMDKAGAYSIQGPSSVFIRKIVGDPFSVMGLPLASTKRLFSQAGLNLWDFRA